MKEELKQFRCMSCNALLFFQRMQAGTIEIQCRKTACKKINVLDMGKGNAKLKKES